jgi:hypothetical protein
LDDPDIIDVLNITKKTSAEVQEKLRNANDAEVSPHHILDPRP